MTMNKLIELLRKHFEIEQIASAKTFATAVHDTLEAFLTLPRANQPIDGLIDLKFKMMHWRRRSTDLLLTFLEGPRDANETCRALEALEALNLTLNDDEARKLCTTIGSYRDASVRAAGLHLFATLARFDLMLKLDPKPSKEMVELAGPRRRLPLTANAPSRVTFKRWAPDKEFSNYKFSENGGVVYRGIHFQPGDLLLSGCNRDGNGVYTTMCEPKGYTYHIGIFANVQHDGRTVPVVAEAYKLGIRIVPLSMFLSPAFNSYVEVCRLKSTPTGFADAINRHAATISDETKGYNFDTEDPDRSYLSCTTLGTHLFELAGAEPIPARSRYSSHPQLRKNLEYFKLTPPAFLSPSDFLTNERFEVVGAIDNNHFHRTVAREICEHYFIEIFKTGLVNPASFPVMFWLNLFGVRQMRKGTVLGRLIGLPYGLTPVNLPRGPENTMAIIEIFEHKLDKTVAKSDPLIRSLWNDSQLVDWKAIAIEPAVAAVVRKHLKPIQENFQPVKSQTAEAQVSP